MRFTFNNLVYPPAIALTFACWVGVLVTGAMWLVSATVTIIVITGYLSDKYLKLLKQGGDVLFDEHIEKPLERWVLVLGIVHGAVCLWGLSSLFAGHWEIPASDVDIMNASVAAMFSAWVLKKAIQAQRYYISCCLVDKEEESND